MVAPHAPPPGDLAQNPGMCPNWESFASQAGTHSTEPHQPGQKLTSEWRMSTNRIKKTFEWHENALGGMLHEQDRTQPWPGGSVGCSVLPYTKVLPVWFFSQDTHLRCGFDSWLGHMRRQRIDVSVMSMFRSLSPFLSLHPQKGQVHRPSVSVDCFLKNV